MKKPLYLREHIDLLKICFYSLAVIAVVIPPEVLMAQELDAVLNTMAYDRELIIKINDIQLKNITGGKSQSLHLFAANAPELKEAAPQYKELFCLKEGENTIEISFLTKPKNKDFAPSPLTIRIESGNYKVAVLQYEAAAEVNKGGVKGKFLIYSKEPKDFKTQILK